MARSASRLGDRPPWAIGMMDTGGNVSRTSVDRPNHIDNIKQKLESWCRSDSHINLRMRGRKLIKHGCREISNWNKEARSCNFFFSRLGSFPTARKLSPPHRLQVVCPCKKKVIRKETLEMRRWRRWRRNNAEEKRTIAATSTSFLEKFFSLFLAPSLFSCQLLSQIGVYVNGLVSTTPSISD